MWLTRFSIQRPIIVSMFFIALAVFGAVSYVQLGKNSQPNVNFPVVVVVASYPGASPSEMERLVVKPIEDQIDGIEHLDTLNATAQEGSAVVVAQFQLGTNLDFAAIDVQRRVDTARLYMPTDLDPPQVSKNGADAPVLTYAIDSKTLTASALADMLNDRVISDIRHIPNVETVGLSGAAVREFDVNADPLRLMGAGATLPDVFNAISANNSNLPGGRIDKPTVETTVSVHADVNSADDIGALPLTVPNGAQTALLVRDVASVTDTHQEQRLISHMNGAPGLILDINRTINSDEVGTTKIVRAQMAGIMKKYPQIEFHELFAPADYTQASLNGVLQSLFEGIFLTGAGADAVPARLAQRGRRAGRDPELPAGDLHRDARARLHARHRLADGTLADHRDSGRRLDRRAGEHHAPSRHGRRRPTMQRSAAAARSAARRSRSRWSTSSSSCRSRSSAGIVGQYMKEFGDRRRRRDAVLAVRLVHAHADAGGEVVGPQAHRRTAASLAWFQTGFERLTDWYKNRALPVTIRHRWMTFWISLLMVANAITLLAGTQAMMAVGGVDVAFAVVALLWIPLGNRLRGRGIAGVRVVGSHAGASVAGAIGCVAIGGFMVGLALLHLNLQTEFVPDQKRGQVHGEITFPVGTPLVTTEATLVKIENTVMANFTTIDTVRTYAGTKPDGWGSTNGGFVGTFNITLRKDHRRDQDDVVAKLRQIIPPIAKGADVTITGRGGGGSGLPISFTLSGPGDVIQPAADKLAAYIKSVPGTVNVQTSAEDAAPHLTVRIDPARAAIFGVSPGAAALAPASPSAARSRPKFAPGTVWSTCCCSTRCRTAARSTKSNASPSAPMTAASFRSGGWRRSPPTGHRPRSNTSTSRSSRGSTATSTAGRRRWAK